MDTARYLRLCRQLYATYPQIRKSLISKFGYLSKGKSPISELPTLAVVDDSAIVSTLSPQWLIPGDKLVEGLSFTHLVELIKLEDPLKRTFYEIECIRGKWSVRELCSRFNWRKSYIYTENYKSFSRERKNKENKSF